MKVRFEVEPAQSARTRYEEAMASLQREKSALGQAKKFNPNKFDRVEHKIYGLYKRGATARREIVLGEVIRIPLPGRRVKPLT